MPDLLIRDIDPQLKRLIEERAQLHRHNLSDEAKSLIRKGQTFPETEMKMGTWLYSLVRLEDRGDDLVFEYRDGMSPPA